MNQATKLIKQDEPGAVDRRAEDSSYRGYGYGPDQSEGEVHLLDYWRAIRKRLWLVIGVAVLMTTPGQLERDTTLRVVCGMSETSFSPSLIIGSL